MISAFWLSVLFGTVGGAFAVRGVLRFSDFLARLCALCPSDAEALSLDTSENWSDKNWTIARYFWFREYDRVHDELLTAMGRSVRLNNIMAVAFVAAAIVLGLFSNLGAHGL